MKGAKVIGFALIITLVFLLVPVRQAKAMNNESAALLAGAIALFGRPVLNAIVQDIFYGPERVYYTPRPTYYTTRPTRVVYKRVYIYKQPCYRPCPPPSYAYERGWCDEMRRILRQRERYEYQRGRIDARWYYYEIIDP
jgi:hypothetical protein